MRAIWLAIRMSNSKLLLTRSLRQQTIADSITEAEYISTSEAAKEAVWMKKFITELDVISEIEQSVSLYCDNTEAVAQEKESRSHHKSKYILRWFHLVRKIVQSYKIGRAHV